MQYQRILELVNEYQRDKKIGTIVSNSLCESKNRILSMWTKGGICIDGQYLMMHVQADGAQTCPFQNTKLDPADHGYDYGSTDIRITSIKTGEFITFNTLLIHMIRMHQFFEGSVNHRLDPVTVIRVLELVPRICYEPIYQTTYKWNIIKEQSFNWRYPIETDRKRFVEIMAHYSFDHQVHEIKDPMTNQLVFVLDAFLVPKQFSLTNIPPKLHLDELNYAELRETMFQIENEWIIDYNFKYLRHNETPLKIYDQNEIKDAIKEEEDMKTEYLALNPKQRSANPNMHVYVLIHEINKSTDMMADKNSIFYTSIKLFGYDVQGELCLSGTTELSLQETRSIKI